MPTREIVHQPRDQFEKHLMEYYLNIELQGWQAVGIIAQFSTDGPNDNGEWPLYLLSANYQFDLRTVMTQPTVTGVVWVEITGSEDRPHAAYRLGKTPGLDTETNWIEYPPSIRWDEVPSHA